MKTLTFWEGERLSYERSLNLTMESLNLYGSQYRHWAMAYSGGKDSTAVVTLVASLLASGAIQAALGKAIVPQQVYPLLAAMVAVEQQKQTERSLSHANN